jgi:hypothetical protein
MHITGSSRATVDASPARLAAPTTLLTSLYAPGASSAMPEQQFITPGGVNRTRIGDNGHESDTGCSKASAWTGRRRTRRRHVAGAASLRRSVLVLA